MLNWRDTKYSRLQIEDIPTNYQEMIDTIWEIYTFHKTKETNLWEVIQWAEDNKLIEQWDRYYLIGSRL